MGKKGSSGGSKAPQVKIPWQLEQDINSLGQLGNYEAQFLNEPYNIGNYYMSLATGGAGPQVTSNPSFQNPNLFGNQITSSINPVQTYGPGGIARTGGGGGGGTTTTTTTGGGTTQQNQGQIPSPPAGSGVESDGRVILPNGEPYYYKGQQVFAPVTGVGQYYTQGTAASTTTTKTTPGAKGKTTPAPPGTQVGGTTFPGTTNPWINEFEQMLGQEYKTAQEIPGIQAETQNWLSDVNAQTGGAENWENYLYGQIPGQESYLAQQEAAVPAAQQFLGGQEQYLQQMETGQLMPGQQAQITSAVNAADAAMNQKLASAGLGSSTMGAELGGEMALQGAGTAGQLMQGNVQAATGGVNAASTALATQFGGVSSANQALATAIGGAQNQAQIVQNFQKLAVAGQELQVGEEQQLYSQFQNIANQSFDAQQVLFNQAMQGYGMEGQFLNQVLAPYGQSMQGLNLVLQAETANANNLERLQEAQISSQNSQASMMGGLFQGLGSLLGGGGGAGAGAAGASVASSGIGVTGALGSGGIDAAVGATAGGGGSAIGGLISGLIGLISAF